MNVHFERMRSPEVGEFADRQGVILVPIGACEEHGRHLPIITDTTIAYQAALDAARSIGEKTPVSVLPPVWFGYTVADLKNWPGTITIRAKVLIDVMYDICRSLIDMGITSILIVNAHGNNPGLLDVAVRSIADDFKVFPGVVHLWNCWDSDFIRSHRKSKEGGIAHAGEVETSLMLHLTDLVDMSVADATDQMTSDLRNAPTDPFSDRKKRLYLSTWYLENSTYGGAGDPTEATAAFGCIIHQKTVDALCDVIEEFHDVRQQLKDRKPHRPRTEF